MVGPKPGKLNAYGQSHSKFTNAKTPAVHPDVSLSLLLGVEMREVRRRYAVPSIRRCSRSAKKVSHGEGFFLSAKDQPFQARYIELAV